MYINLGAEKLIAAEKDREKIAVEIIQGDHYQLINVEWHENKRLRGCVLQIDLKSAKKRSP